MKVRFFIFGFIFLFCFASFSSALQTDRISQYGIIWYFDGKYDYGQFANGDYWVKGPVVITRIAPDFSGTSNGWEANPINTRRQGFDNRVYGFDPLLVPSLPYLAMPDTSIVKSVSVPSGSCEPCLDVAAVLTVVGSIPSNDGSTVFRPAYFGNSKIYYSTNDLATEMLPSLPTVSNAPTLSFIENRFKKVQLDHLSGWEGRKLHPVQNMPDYGADIGRDTAEGALRLMLNDPVSPKMQALINYVQQGIDFYGILFNGGSWNADGGHSVGRKLPITFAAVLLNDPSIVEFIFSTPTSFFDESGHLVYSSGGNPLFGEDKDEFTYWRSLAIDSGSRDSADPYRRIDGGQRPGKYYQTCCTANPWKGTALAVMLMPSLQKVWNDDKFLYYVTRWVNYGTYTAEDNCAPLSGVCAGGKNVGGSCNTAGENGNLCSGKYCNIKCPSSYCDYSSWRTNYGVTFGPDPTNPGSCILDTNLGDGMGRFPLLNNLYADQGQYDSVFADGMWTLYKSYTGPYISRDFVSRSTWRSIIQGKAVLFDEHGKNNFVLFVTGSLILCFGIYFFIKFFKRVYK